MAGGVYQNRGVRIEGLRELNARLRAAGDDSQDMPDLMQRIGNIVIENARVPADSGELRGTLRAGRGRTKAVVRAGYARRGAHAGVVHYGDPHRNHRAQPFLVDALRRTQPQIVSELSDGINEILHRHNLT
ncbi:hypothetical protein K8F61_18575 [Microbacterium resistens]|uniref:HK97 gp10 family phage protein n=1 Tax=Microbacterium resistens TaxID=156977 RepID=A0ABY3RV53_9MICO|nr:hypothetical protein [Microbacterium resistens]UGS26591.1 hypothetical protein K8F61_18575 [Microbacterium resistens]